MLTVDIFYHSYDIMFDPDCQPISSSEDYFADIYMARRASGTQDDRFLVVFWSSDNLDNNYEVPSSLKVPGNKLIYTVTLSYIILNKQTKFLQVQTQSWMILNLIGWYFLMTGETSQYLE